MITTLSVLAVVTAVAVPSYVSSHKAAVVESKATQLLSMLEVGQSESIKRHSIIYVHYVPVTEDANGCIGLSTKSDVGDFSCTASEGLQKFIIESGGSVTVQEPATSSAEKLFHFSPKNGLPSVNKTVKLAKGSETGKESGILIRQYSGLKGCSNTVVTGWESCS
ncbi:prepilin-type cleavage/methylation domain-containing protein [Enterovibrio sp. 27052020O]|uniref:prepilin-type cleavage/methylation domain-containing protein n=1 Tax=Enterovibrio sp. 27052020O TaxID=3241166 RepID=UPI00388F6529